MSERELQTAVCELLELFGWRWMHQRPARTRDGWRTAISGDAGFPDIVAVRERVVWIELKSENGRLSAEQGHWLAELGYAGMEVHCWRPSDWRDGVIEEALR
jgi:VRR-NUC domain